MRLKHSAAIGAVLLSVLLGLAGSATCQIYRIAEMNTRQILSLPLEKTVVIIPGGILEEHGPYLASFTDGYATQAYTDSFANVIVARPGWSVVLFPQIPLGSDPANTIATLWKFPGSYPVRTATVRAIYMDLASALGEQGFRWVFLIYNHGAPTHNRALDEASDYFHDTFGGTMVNLFGLMPVSNCCGVEGKFLSADALAEEGFTVHAGADETSVLYFLKPDLLAPDHRQAVSWTSHSIPELVQNAHKMAGRVISARRDWPVQRWECRCSFASQPRRMRPRWRSWTARTTTRFLATPTRYFPWFRASSRQFWTTRGRQNCRNKIG